MKPKETDTYETQFKLVKDALNSLYDPILLHENETWTIMLPDVDHQGRRKAQLITHSAPTLEEAVAEAKEFSWYAKADNKE